MINSIKYIVLVVFIGCQVLVVPCPSLAQETIASNEKQSVKLNIEIVKTGVCNQDRLEILAKITNEGAVPVAFYPDALWSRIVFLASTVIDDGIGRAGIFMTTGHSFGHRSKTLKYSILNPGKTLEYSKDFYLTNEFFKNSREYVLWIRYYNPNEAEYDKSGVRFLDEVESNEVYFNMPVCELPHNLSDNCSK